MAKTLIGLLCADNYYGPRIYYTRSGVFHIFTLLGSQSATQFSSAANKPRHIVNWRNWNGGIIHQEVEISGGAFCFDFYHKNRHSTILSKLGHLHGGNEEIQRHCIIKSRQHATTYTSHGTCHVRALQFNNKFFLPTTPSNVHNWCNTDSFSWTLYEWAS